MMGNDQTIRNRTRKLIILVLSVLVCEICGTGYIRGEAFTIEGAVSYFQEEDRRLSISEVASETYRSRFIPATSNTLNLGYSAQACWIRIDIIADKSWEQPYTVLELDTVKLNRIDLYRQGGNGNWYHQQDGIDVAGADRQGTNPHFSFMLPQMHQGTSLFLRVEAIYFRIPIRLWSLAEFNDKQTLRTFSDGAFYGITLAIIVYHFFIFLAIRNRSYLIYAVFLVLVGGWYLSGQGWAYAFLFSRLPEPLNRLTHLSSALAGWLLVLCGLQFTAIYLNLSAYARTTARIFKWLQWAVVGFGLIGIMLIALDLIPMFVMLYNIGFALMVMAISLCFYAAFRGIRHRQSTATYYLVATSLQFLVSLVMMLSVFQLVPLAFDWKMLQWCSVIEMLIFSFGLSRQVKAIESDKQRINQELLQTRELTIEQLKTINDLKDKVLSRVMESRLYPEFARLFAVMNDILYVQAVGNFSKIVYLDEGMENAIEIQASLKDIETCFDETVFIRIHKTYLIKQGQKVTLQRRSTADYEIVSRHFVLPVGRTFSAKLRQMLSID